MIGALRHQIDLLAETLVADGAGGASASWMIADTVWAAVERLTSIRDPSGGRARRQAIAARVRPNSGFALGGRIRFEGVDYEIASIETDDDRNQRLMLTCEEISP